MGFWEDNPDLQSGAGGYVKKEGKASLAETEITIVISNIAQRLSKFKDDDGNDIEEFVISIQTAEDIKDLKAGEYFLTFPLGSVESRDRTLERMAKYLDDPSNTVEAVLKKIGKSYVIVPA